MAYEYGDEYAYEIAEGVLGQLWFERNIAVINVGEIVRTAKEVSSENQDLADIDYFFSEEYQIQMGILTTILHELRHLQMDTNILLPEDKYPLYLGLEANVEEYCRAVYEEAGIPVNMMPYLITGKK